MPTGTTSYRSGSIACSTLPAVTQEIACSLERPPNTTAIARLAGADGVVLLVLAHGGPDPTGPVTEPLPDVDLRWSHVRRPDTAPTYARFRPATVAVTAGRPPHEPDNPLNDAADDGLDVRRRR